MNDILKQRLVGALVLIALGVLFWPVIFVKTERPDIDRTPRVQPMPELAEVDIPPPTPLPDVESVDMVDVMRNQSTGMGDAQPGEAASAGAEVAGAETAENAETADSGEPPASPVLDEEGIPVAWVLQVASVSTREKADKLTADLIAAGYKAYHRTIRRDEAVLYRVFVGPVFEREKLAAAKRDVDQRLNVSAIIVRYVP